MGVIRAASLVQVFLITLFCVHSVHADEYLDDNEQQLGRMQQQLDSLTTITPDIVRLKEQLGLLKEQLTRIKNDVVSNEHRFNERLTQIELDMTGYQRRSDELKSGSATIRKQLKSGMADLVNDIQTLGKKNALLNDELTLTKYNLEQNKEMAARNEHELVRIEGSLNKRTSLIDKEISSVNQDIFLRTIYVAISIIVLILIVLWLRRRLTIDNAALSGEMSRARDALDSEYNALDLKLSEILEKQISVASLSSQSSNQQGESDHSLPLKVATEIHRMRKRIASMSDDTKGIKPLAKALERLEENLAEQDYEIIDLLGQKYVNGMSVNQDFILDEELPPGEQIITKVIKPQVNYNNEIIQVADVVVSTGE